MSNDKQQPLMPVGVGATGSSSSVVPALVIGGALLAGLAAVLYLGSQERKKSVDEEADELFPPSPTSMSRLPRGRHALHYERAAARCFYKELRDTHGPADAARIAQAALTSKRRHLAPLAHIGATVARGCEILRAYHAPRSYYQD